MKTKTKLTPQIARMYLGCEVEIEGEWFQNKPIIAKLVDVQKDGTVEIKNNQGKTIERNIEHIKLILRSIDDLCYWEYMEEYSEWESLKVPQVANSEAKRTLWLIKKRFDVFQLIKSGCAIRKQN